jgi:hypothetical protein
MSQEGGELVGRQRDADEVALLLVAFLLAQESLLLFRLHAFGDDDEIERLAKRDDRIDNGFAFRAAADFADERAVDLERFQG